MQQKYSAIIGIVGGVIDAIAGLALLQPSTMMGRRPVMATPSTAWAGYFLLALGLIVLLTGLYMLTARMMRNRSLFGWLMIVYGVTMLILGAGMIGEVFSMMQGSTISGGVMILVGLAMLYSGFGMAGR